jgi:hypothetical protein
MIIEIATESRVIDRSRSVDVRRRQASQIAIGLAHRLHARSLRAREFAATTAPAALADAVFGATGARLTTVPFNQDRVRAALGS